MARLPPRRRSARRSAACGVTRTATTGRARTLGDSINDGTRWLTAGPLRRHLLPRDTRRYPRPRQRASARRSRVRAGHSYLIRRRRGDGVGASLLVVIAVLAAVTAGAMRELDIGRELELETVDVRFKIRGPVPPPDDVVLVQVDERTLERAGPALAVPALAARARDRPARRGRAARDRRSTSSSPSPPTIDEDNALIEAIAAAEPGRARHDRRRRPGPRRTSSAATKSSTASARGSAVGCCRPIRTARCGACPTPSDGLESFAVVTAEVATRRQVAPFDEDRTWIDYAGPPGTLRAYSYSHVLRGRVPAGGLPRQGRRDRHRGGAPEGRLADLDHRRAS